VDPDSSATEILVLVDPDSSEILVLLQTAYLQQFQAIHETLLIGGISFFVSIKLKGQCHEIFDPQLFRQ
jgi:hypothetical protein